MSTNFCAILKHYVASIRQTKENIKTSEALRVEKVENILGWSRFKGGLASTRQLPGTCFRAIEACLMHFLFYDM